VGHILDDQRSTIYSWYIPRYGGSNFNLHAHFLPIAMQFRMAPTQLGIVTQINCALELNTPPVGTAQFVGCAIDEILVGQVMRSIAPFYGALGLCLLLVTYVPAFSLWISRPNNIHNVIGANKPAQQHRAAHVRSNGCENRLITFGRELHRKGTRT
jgi:Tripartite ATP-independent periplasmic transporter, DctM component